jgi:alkylhydroperoxidase family enzyme
MTERYSDLVERLRDTVLSGRGVTDPSLRRAVEARAAEAGGRPAPARAEVPDALVTYIDKVARHAYRVTDEDTAALRNAGYSEDAIFELTVSAALGSGLGRLERGLAALRGAV